MASSKATTAAAYLAELPADRRAVMSAVRDVVNGHLPRGYTESMQYGMICWGVPLARYPNTYNGQPIGIAALAAQKNYYALYLMGVYSDPATETWFRGAFAKAGKKLDMGKSCVRFKRLDDLPLGVIGAAIERVSVEELIAKHDAVHGGSARQIRAQATKQPAAKKRPAAKKQPAVSRRRPAR